MKVQICFPDNPDEHMIVLKKLLDFYIANKGTAGSTLADVFIEDDYLVVEFSKGFHCIYLPLEELRRLLKEE